MQRLPGELPPVEPPQAGVLWLTGGKPLRLQPTGPRYALIEAAPMPFEFLISALVTLLVVVDPIGLVPTFLAVTQGL